MSESRASGAVQELDHSFEPRAQTPGGRKRRVRGSMIAQFAANDGSQLADAAELIKPWVDGIDLNCGPYFLPQTNPCVTEGILLDVSGCPQKWAYNEGIGCALLRKPELVADLVRTTKQRVGWEFPVSVKIRVDKDLQYVLVLPARPLSRFNARPALPCQAHRPARPDSYRGWCGLDHGTRSHSASVLFGVPCRPRRHRVRRFVRARRRPCSRQRRRLHMGGGGGDKKKMWSKGSHECAGASRKSGEPILPSAKARALADSVLGRRSLRATRRRRLRHYMFVILQVYVLDRFDH